MRIFFTLFLFLCYFQLSFSQSIDTTKVYLLNPITTTADKYERPLASTSGAIAKITASEMAQLPANNLADILENFPGIALLNTDGIGFRPQATVRGFYGGGEAEYVLVLIDGVPINQLETGLIDWNSIPLNNIASIEILRGSSSSLYGDAAIGGIVSIQTKGLQESLGVVKVGAGSYGELSTAATFGRSKLKAYFNYLDSKGFRDAPQNALSFGATYQLNQKLSLQLQNAWTTSHDAGPLEETNLETTLRSSRNPFFQADSTDERQHRISFDWNSSVGNNSFQVSLTGFYRGATINRTLLLAPSFPDSKNRNLSSQGITFSSKWVRKGLNLIFPGRWVLGVDGNYASLNTNYFNIDWNLSASPLPTPNKTDKISEGEGTRSNLAAFSQVELFPTNQLSLTFGIRFDQIKDSYEVSLPEVSSLTATHQALSPKVALNYAFVNKATQQANVYATASRSFKAPTLDQSFDQRPLPVPFPPYQITISNNLLEPQTGINKEIGGYFLNQFSPSFSVSLSLAVYRMDMENEFDFSFESFRYENIAKSTHKGLESGLRGYIGKHISFNLNYTKQATTYAYGDYIGKYVKAIPQDVYGGGLQLSNFKGFSCHLGLQSFNNMFVDDANTIPIPNYATVNAKVSYQKKVFGIYLEGFNLANETYSSTGYPDPAGTGLTYFYPAAPRHGRIGLSFTL